MSHDCHVPRLVTDYPGLVTEQSHRRASTWSLSSRDSVTARLAGGDVDGDLYLAGAQRPGMAFARLTPLED